MKTNNYDPPPFLKRTLKLYLKKTNTVLSGFMIAASLITINSKTFAQCADSGVPPVVTFSTTPASCPNSGKITLNINSSFGGAPFSLILTGSCITPTSQSGNGTSFTFASLQGGCIYSVQITDGANNKVCKSGISIADTYTPMSALSLTDTMYSSSACSFFSAGVIGGNAPYSYELFIGGSATGTPVAGPQASNKFIGINPNTIYTARITDACGNADVISKTSGPLANISLGLDYESGYYPTTLATCNEIRAHIKPNGCYGSNNFATNTLTQGFNCGINFPLTITAKNSGGTVIAGYPYTITAGSPAPWGQSSNTSLPDLFQQWAPFVPNNPALFPVTYSFTDGCGSTTSVTVPYDANYNQNTYWQTPVYSSDAGCPPKLCASQYLDRLGGRFISGQTYAVSLYTNSAGTGVPLQSITFPTQKKFCGLSYGTTYYYKVHDNCANNDTILGYTTPTFQGLSVDPAAPCFSYCLPGINVYVPFTGSMPPTSVVASSGPAAYSATYPANISFDATSVGGYIELINLRAGTYNFTFSNGCGESASISLDVPAATLTATPTHTIVPSCANATVTIFPRINSTGQLLTFHNFPTLTCFSFNPTAVPNNNASYWASISFRPLTGTGTITPTSIAYPTTGGYFVADYNGDGYSVNVTTPGTYEATINYREGLAGYTSYIPPHSCSLTVLDTFTVVFNDPPQELDVNAISCSGGKYILLADVPGVTAGTSYTLYAADGVTLLAGPQSTNAFGGITGVAGDKFFVRATDACGRFITTQASLYANTSIDGSVTCGYTLTPPLITVNNLSAEFINGASYTWTSPGGNTYLGFNPGSVPPENGTWHLSSTLTVGTCSSTLSNSFIITCFAVPVKLINFTAVPIPVSSALLNWSTSSEQYIDRFEIQHSFDGINFSQCGIVTTADRSNEETEYSFKDVHAVSGVNYYRLRMVQTSGSIIYSNIRMVMIGSESHAFVLPNPVRETLYVGDVPAGTELSLLSTDGRMLMHRTAQSCTETIDMNKYPRGFYFLQLWDKAAGKLISNFKITKE